MLNVLYCVVVVSVCICLQIACWWNVIAWSTISALVNITTNGFIYCRVWMVKNMRTLKTGKNYILSGEWRWPLTGSEHVQKWVVLLSSGFTLFLGCTLQIMSTYMSHLTSSASLCEAVNLWTHHTNCSRNICSHSGMV